MNIVYVVDQWPKLSQSFVFREVMGLVKRGHSVAVWACSVDEDPNIAHKGFESLDIPVGSADDGRLSPRGAAQFLTNGSAVWRLKDHTEFLQSPIRAGSAMPWAGELLRFLDDLPWSPDIIHTHFLTDWAWAAVYSADVIGAKASGTAHAFDIFREDLVTQLPTLSQNLDLIVTISEKHREYISCRSDSSTPVRIVHCGVDPSQFSPTKGTVSNRIVTVARNSPKKGLRFGIEALSQVKGDYTDLEWRIIGTEDNSLKTVAQKHNVGEKVTLLGRVTDKRLKEELDAASLTLLPCVIEKDGNRDGIPVALMEAMAMETVPVSSPVSGIPELIHDGINGYLSPVLETEDGLQLPKTGTPKVSGSFIDTLDRALTDDHNKRGKKARKTIEESFNVKLEVCKLEKIFSDLVEGAL